MAFFRRLTSLIIAASIFMSMIPASVFAKESAETLDSSEAVMEVTVHFYNANGWCPVNGYVWDSTQTTMEWPGTELTADSGRIGWYTMTVSDEDGTFG